jgi:hypothetical protein
MLHEESDLLTDYMEQNRSRKANSCLAGHKIFHILWSLKADSVSMPTRDCHLSSF